MDRRDDEDALLQSMALQNAHTILVGPREIEQELRKQYEWWQVTLQSIGDGVITTDTDGRVLTLNRVAQELTGWTQEDSQARPLGEVFRIIDEHSRAALPNPVEQVLRENRVIGLGNSTLLLRRDGRETAIEDSAAPIRDTEGRVRGAVLIFRDVTEARHAAEAQARLAAIVESSDDAIISKTLDGTIRSWNKGAEALFGYRGAEAVGQSITLIIPPERVDEERLILDRLTRGERIEHYETIRVAKNGRRLAISLTISPLRDRAGRIIGAAKIARDITARLQAEQALRRSEAEFRQLADSLPQIVWTARPDGRIDYYNERWYEFTGFARNQFGDQSWLPILHPDDVERCLDAYYGCVRSGRIYQIEYRFKDHRSGAYRWFLGRAYPMRDDEGRIARWFGTCTDIDDTKRAEEKTRFLADAGAALSELTDYRSTLQKVAALAVPFFADLCTVDMGAADEALQRLAVTHSDSAKVRLVEELARRYPPQPNDPHGIMRVLRSGVSEWLPTIPDALLVAAARDNEHLMLLRQLGLHSYICTPLRARGRILGVLTFATAESGRRYGAADLNAAEDLAHRAVIAIENARLLATLREGDRRKDEFLAMLAHELRNPLAPIRNAVHILRGKGAPGPELNWATEVIDRQVHQLTRLVDDLLDVSRITRGKIELRKERVELASIVTSAVEASRPLIEKWGHQLTVSMPPEPIYLDADAVRLAQVLLNLLNNAAKYTDHGGRIWLSAARREGQVTISVRDTGLGIPQEMLARIFDMFVQVERSLDRSEGGLGIGLTLVQRLVHLHGGAIEARSGGPGQGSEFMVTLPVLADSSADQGPAAGDVPGAMHGAPHAGR